MDINTLIEGLNQFQPQLFGRQNTSCDVKTLRLFIKGQTFFDSEVLYLGNAALLPQEIQQNEFIFICLGMPENASDYDNSSFSLITIEKKCSSEEIINHIQDLLSRTLKFTSLIQILMNSLLSNQGLQTLVDQATEFFENPIYVVDLQGKYIAISSRDFPDNAFLNQERQEGYIDEEGIRIIRQYRIDENVRTSDKPYFFDNPLKKEKMLISAIHIQGIEVGHIMIQECHSPFNNLSYELLVRFSQIISMELQKDSVFTYNKGVFYSYFLADLLGKTERNTAYVTKRLRTLGYNLKEELYILTIPSISSHSSTLQLDVITNQISRILRGSIYVIYEDTIVFLISREKYKGFSEREIVRLSEFLSANDLKAGISNFYRDINDTRRFYKQAISSVKMGIHLQSPHPLCYYKDYYVHLIFQICEKADPEIRYLIHPGLMQLYNYDKEKNTTFVSTLREYLKSPGQSSKIADKLNIHKNTLLYRIRKIKEITDCTLKQGDDYMFLGLSFKLMEYLKML